MKRFINTSFLFATLVMSLAAVAGAGDRGTCRSTAVVGTWGYTLTGYVILPSGPAPFATVGRVIFHVDGTISGTQIASLGGQVSEDTILGTWEPTDPDGIFTFSVGLYDDKGNLLRTADWAGVHVDSGRESRAIMTSLVLPNGTSIPAIVTLNAKRLYPGNSGAEHKRGERD